MEVQSESNIHFETRDGIWMMEQEKGAGIFQLACAGPWDEYDISNSYPILYWGQSQSFIQLAKNLWNDGFKFLVDQVEGLEPKRSLKFEFKAPFIPKKTLVTCYIAYNGTGVLYRFSDPLNPTDYRQILISGADDRFPNGSVKFSIFHCNNNNNGGENSNSSFTTTATTTAITNNNSHIIYGKEEVYTYYWMKSASSKIKTESKKRWYQKNKEPKELQELCYPLDFCLDSKFFIKDYPLIIRPLNRFYDIRSLYMVELAEKCLFHQSIEHIEEFRNDALVKKEKLQEIFLYYPKLLKFCLWYYTPKKKYEVSDRHSLIFKKRGRGKNKINDNFFSNLLASIAHYISSDSTSLDNYPKITLSQQPISDYHQLTIVQYWINKIYHKQEHHCSQCEAWYSQHLPEIENSFTIFSSDPSKKFNYKNNKSIMNALETENYLQQQEGIKTLKENFEELSQKSIKKKKKKEKKGKKGKKEKKEKMEKMGKKDKEKLISSKVDVTKTSTNIIISSSSSNMNSDKPSPIQSHSKGLFSHFFKNSSISSSPNLNKGNNNNTQSNNDNVKKIIKENSPYDSEDWITVNNQSYLNNEINNEFNSGTITTSNNNNNNNNNNNENGYSNLSLDPDSSMEKMYDNSFNYDFNIDSIAQIPNSQQQLDNILRENDLLIENGQEKVINEDNINISEQEQTTTTFYNGRMEEREQNIMEWTRESALTNFGLNITNAIATSTYSTITSQNSDKNNSNNINNGKSISRNKNRDKAIKTKNKFFQDTTTNNSVNDIVDIIKNHKLMDWRQQESHSRIKQKIHCCLSSTYYHISPNTTVNECSSESCYFENREQLAQELISKLSYYAISYKWAKCGLQIGFLIGLYLISQKFWNFNQFWSWIREECQDQIMLLSLKGQYYWMNYLEKSQPYYTRDYQEILEKIKKKEKLLKIIRFECKSKKISEERAIKLRDLRREIGTALKEVRELINMIVLKNYSQVFKQWKKDIIELYCHRLKVSMTLTPSWNNILFHLNILMGILKLYFFKYFNLLKKNWNPQPFTRLMKSLHLIKWWNERFIFIQTFIQLSINRPPSLITNNILINKKII